MNKRQPIPLVRSPDAISSAFAQARETIAVLEAKRVEAVCPEWSPSQHARSGQ